MARMAITIESHLYMVLAYFESRASGNSYWSFEVLGVEVD